MPRDDAPALTPDDLLNAYRLGFFPMADARDDDRLMWVRPEERGVFPLDGLKISKSLRKSVRKTGFEVSVNRDFPAVIAACAEATSDRPDTWINHEIERLYTALHLRGAVHSVECRLDGALVGGLYGVSIGAAFFGESMFSRATDASKVALVHLVARLNAAGYRLLDAQFVNDHIATLGAVGVPREHYEGLLADALAHEASFMDAPVDHADLEAVLQSASGAGSSNASSSPSETSGR